MACPIPYGGHNKRYHSDGGAICPADGHFGPFRWLDDPNEHGKWYAAYDFLFTFSSNHGSISLNFRDIADVSFSASRTFWPLPVAARPRWPMDSSFSTGLPIRVLLVTVALKRTVFELGAWNRRTDGHRLCLVLPLWWRGTSQRTRV